MATIITRSGKGSPLTNTEVDNNFTNLNSDKLESGDTVASLTLTSADINGGTIDGVTIGGESAGAATFTSATVNGNPIATAGSLSNRNRIINGNFGINQRVVSGTVSLSAGDYGHDRWKAGASGCTYTFATSANVTTITISAGSLVQVIEGLNLQSGTHVLSWTGTVQMKIDGGSAGNSGMTGTLTGGTNATVETSGTGTLSLVQLEAGDTATPFEHRSYGQELALCQRYFYKTYNYNTAIGTATLIGMYSTLLSQTLEGTGYIEGLGIPTSSVPMRVAPSIVVYDSGGNVGKASYYASAAFSTNKTVTITQIGDKTFYFYSDNVTTKGGLGIHYTTNAEL